MFSLNMEVFVSTGSKKKQLHVDKPDDLVADNTYDGYDEYDFMWTNILNFL